MVPGISSLKAKKIGLASNIMEFRNVLIKKLKQKIRTGCGYSEESYQHDVKDAKINGEVKVKGDVASLWCLTLHKNLWHIAH